MRHRRASHAHGHSAAAAAGGTAASWEYQISFTESRRAALVHSSLRPTLKKPAKHAWFEFVLLPAKTGRGAVLLFFETPGDLAPRGQITVTPTCRVVPQYSEGQHGFLVIDGDARHVLFAKNKRECSLWLVTLEDLVQGTAPRVVASRRGANHDGGDDDDDDEASHHQQEQDPVIVEPKLVQVRSIEELYEVRDVLGEGGNSVVKRGIRRRDNLEVALKFMPIEAYRQAKEEIDEEIMILAACKHKNILRLYEVVTTREHVVMSLELLHGSELFTRIVSREQYDEEDAKVVALDMLEAIDYLHTHGIVHCDLKPENLIFDLPGEDAVLKLVDFGLSSLLKPNGRLSRFCGTPQYTAPEMLERKPYDQAVDMWSCGVIIYILLCGYPPFYAHTDTLLGYKIVRGKFQFHDEHWGGISAEAKDLITQLLELNPRKRLNSRRALRHPWFQKHSVPAAHATDLSDALIQLQRFKVARRFKEVVNTIVFANKLMAQGDEP